MVSCKLRRIALLCTALALATPSPGMYVALAGSPPEPISLPDIAIAIEDTSGTGALYLRPLAQYQWLDSGRAKGIPAVTRGRSTALVFEEEISGEFHVIEWDSLQSISQTDSPDSPRRTLVTIRDGRTYRCLPGYTQPGRIPELIGSPPCAPTTQVTRSIKAFRGKGAQQVEVEIPWASVLEVEVYPLAGMSSATLKHLEQLIDERGHLRRRAAAVETELASLRNRGSPP